MGSQLALLTVILLAIGSAAETGVLNSGLDRKYPPVICELQAALKPEDSAGSKWRCCQSNANSSPLGRVRPTLTVN